ncbi:MAG: hypothetical protein HDR21_12130 [Lachnospiraceae bacterium]|nr:hypothetical protein [Lachnospiraceae bacterium]
MVVSIEDALRVVGQEIPEEVLKRKILAIESLIRDETGNGFQDRHARFYAESTEDGLVCVFANSFLAAGDTVEIGESVNAGLFTVAELTQSLIRLDRQLYPAKRNMVTKIVYPPAVQEGVLQMLQWDFNMRSKVGIKSETLSRHSVSYYDMDAGNSQNGYPRSLLGFLEPYYKARF